MNEDITQYPIRILNLFTIMDRGGAETMVMNYYRHIDRTKVQFDFLVHREQSGVYEDEIKSQDIPYVPDLPTELRSVQTRYPSLFSRAPGIQDRSFAHV